jgi:LPS O-antigen subunit length determinant protein (WzzB/FepE family)
MHALEELGFTQDEATRLLNVAVRLTHSDEARVAEATRKRLQFAKWLVEQGLLDEFSLHD